MAQKVDDPVFFYEGRFYPFSNFSSFAVAWCGELWMTSEHAYQAAKFADHRIILLILKARSAHDAKKIAHHYESEKRPDWDEKKLGIMEDILSAKLRQHEFVQKRLLETGDREIIEDSHKDSFWGWGPDKQGANHLGKIWMKLRTELRSKRIAA